MNKKTNRPHLSEMESGWSKFWKSFWQNTKPQIEMSFCLTGRIEPKLKTKITKTINQIIIHHEIFKIGKTGDSYIRSDQKDYRNDYTYMYLIYKSTSPDNISKLEEHYIEKYMKSHPENNQNKRVKSPGKKMYSYDGFYYLYLVCAN